MKAEYIFLSPSWFVVCFDVRESSKWYVFNKLIQNICNINKICIMTAINLKDNAIFFIFECFAIKKIRTFIGKRYNKVNIEVLNIARPISKK